MPIASVRPDTINFYGHSYCFGTGATSIAGEPATNNGFPDLVAGKLGAQKLNRGIAGSIFIPGDQSSILGRVFADVAPVPVAPYTATIQCGVIYGGINDLSSSDINNNLSMLTGYFRAAIDRLRAGGVWECESSTAFVTAQGSGSQAPTVTTAPGFSSTGLKRFRDNGNTWTMTLPSDFPAGKKLTINGVANSTTGATHTITKNGSAYSTWDTRNTPSTQYSVTRWESPAGLQPGDVLVGTISSLVGGAGGVEFLDYAQVQAVDAPLVIICGINRAISKPPTTQAQMQAADAAVKTMLTATYPGDNRVVYIDTDALLQVSPALFNADQVHPNNAGHLAIADAITAAILTGMPTQTVLAKFRTRGRDVQPTRRVPQVGIDARAGLTLLAAGTVTLTNYALTAGAIVHLTRKTPGGALGHLSYVVTPTSALTPGTCVITSTSSTETSVVSYEIVEAG